jgi:hypothetical protein
MGKDQFIRVQLEWICHGGCSAFKKQYYTQLVYLMQAPDTPNYFLTPAIPNEPKI